MKRLLVLLAVLGAIAAPGRLKAQTIRVGLGGQLSSIVNVPIEVPLVVDLSGRPELLGAYSLRLQWNTAVLRLEQGQSGSFGDPAVNGDSLPFGVLRIAGVSPAGVGGVVTLFNVRLTPLVKDTAIILVSLTELFTAGTFVDLMPFVVVSDGLYCPARGLFGDVDGDGNVNSRDALIALSNAVGLDVSAFDISLGDVDASSTTNARDALIILSSAVGIDVGAYRVSRLAGGSCSSNASLTLSIAPAGVELVQGQEVWLEARAADSTGALQTIADAAWKTSNASVLGIFSEGRAVARDTGTAVVTAMRGTRDSAQTTVHVVARRTTHWVDAAAAHARNRLGTLDLPFGSIGQGLSIAQDGDTVRVRPGLYETDSAAGGIELSRPVVLMGDTAADGSRPLIVGPGAGTESAGLGLTGTGPREVHNFAVESFGAGVWVTNSGRALLRGLVVRDVAIGAYLPFSIENVSIEHSRMTGTQSAMAGVKVLDIVDTLSIEDSEISEFIYGVSLSPAVDSFAVRRSSLHDLYASAVTVGSGGDVCEECEMPGPPVAARLALRAPGRLAPARRGGADLLPPPNQALVFEGNRLARAGGSLVNVGSRIRSVAFANNVLTSPGSSMVVYVSPDSTGGYVSFHGDSIVAPPENQHYQWLLMQNMDSLVVDSLVAIGFHGGQVLNVPLVRMSNSTLREARSSALGVMGGMRGGVVHLRNVGVYGDSRDAASATGFGVEGMRVDADSVTAVNLLYGLTVSSDSSASLANSLFQRVAYGIQWYPGTVTEPDPVALTVSGTTFRGFSTALSASGGRVVVDSNTFENGTLATDIGTPHRVSVTRNQLTTVVEGLQVYLLDRSDTATIADNVLVNVGGQQAIYVDGFASDTTEQVIEVLRNTVTCSADGAWRSAGVEVADAHFTIVGNHVANCMGGVLTTISSGPPRRDSIVGNVVDIHAGAYAGIGAAGAVEAVIDSNTITGATTGVQEYGVIELLGTCGSGYCGPAPSASITRNTVDGGTAWGIHTEGVDSLVIAGNTIRNVNAASHAYGVSSNDAGGISVMGYLARFARIVGNVVRDIRGNGIVVHHTDTTTVQVDSNVVANVDSSGVYLGWNESDPGIAITRNLLTGALRDGILIEGYGPVVVTGNNIVGNLPWGLRVNADRSTVDVLNNWWGDSLGPSCGVEGCYGVVGDTVDANMAYFAPFLTAPNAEAPAMPSPAPPFRALAVTAAAPPAAPRLAAGQRATTSTTAARPFARRSAAERRAAQVAEREQRLQRLREARAALLERLRQAATAPQAARAGREVRP